MRISQIVEEVCMNSGYEQYIRELGDEERLENLAELKRIASEFESNYGEEISLSEFLQFPQFHTRQTLLCLILSATICLSSRAKKFASGVRVRQVTTFP